MGSPGAHFRSKLRSTKGLILILFWSLCDATYCVNIQPAIYVESTGNLNNISPLLLIKDYA